MKTKNMRKKALVSSIAMLLVAVVALGGATYAWFSTNTAATATGVNIASSQSTSLLFAPTGTQYDAEGWSSSVDLTTGATAQTVTPCSSVDGSSLFAVTIGDSPSELQTEVVSVDTANSTTNFYESSFLAKCTTASYLKVDSVGFKPAADGGLNEFAGLLRVSVQIGGASGQTKIFYIGNTAPTNYALGSTYTATPGSEPVFADLYALQADNVSGLTKAQPTYSVAGEASAVYSTPFQVNATLPVTVRVWLEGNDPACNNNMMAKTVSGLILSFSTSNTAGA